MLIFTLRVLQGLCLGLVAWQTLDNALGGRWGSAVFGAVILTMLAVWIWAGIKEGESEDGHHG